MSPLPFKRSLALLCVLLSACAATTSAVPEDIEAPDAVYSWEEARADPSCVVPLCDQ
ncbi:MAG: SitA family polymorphic toxin lipoprotein, partial [Archangium sp.]